MADKLTKKILKWHIDKAWQRMATLDEANADYLKRITTLEDAMDRLIILNARREAKE